MTMRGVIHRMSAYLGFVLRHRRLLAFGVIAATLSGFGQTFFIGLFNDELRDAFTLSHGEIGLIYGSAILASAVALIIIGRLYDRIRLQNFVILAAVILSAGCALLSVSTVLAGLVAALFLLRLGGQGMMGHIATTTMARRFHGGRGKAVSVVALGFPLAEALFPLGAVLLLAIVTWRDLWWIGAIVVPVVFLPVMLQLLHGAEGGEAPSEHSRQRIGPDWRPAQVIRDPRFLLLTPAAVTGPFVVTIAFFHQIPLATDKGWTLELMASGLALFALGHVSGLLLGGPCVDRWSALRVLPPALTPIVGALIVLALFDATWAALLWPALLGLGLGLAGTASGALLTELYGVTHLGAIRAMLQAVMIVATAIGPPVVGWLLDHDVGTTAIALGLAVSVTLTALLAMGSDHSKSLNNR